MPDEFVNDEELLEEEGVEEESSQTQEEDVVSQTKIDELIRKVTARERARTEKMLKQMFGSDLKSAAMYLQAGQAVAKASGKTPQEILQRIQQQGGVGNSAGEDVTVKGDLQEIKELLAGQFAAEVREKEVKSARKEFGELYDEFEDDITEMADDRGLPLVDAAAIILRPHLGKLYEKRTLEKSQKVRKKKVEGGEEAPATKGAVNYAEVLSPQQKRVAQKMGIPLSKYYAQLKQLGRIE